MAYTVHGILLARILEWVAFPSPGVLPHPGIEPRSPTLQADSLVAEPQGFVYRGPSQLPLPYKVSSFVLPGLACASPDTCLSQIAIHCCSWSNLFFRWNNWLFHCFRLIWATNKVCSVRSSCLESKDNLLDYFSVSHWSQASRKTNREHHNTKFFSVPCSFSFNSITFWEKDWSYPQHQREKFQRRIVIKDPWVNVHLGSEFQSWIKPLWMGGSVKDSRHGQWGPLLHCRAVPETVKSLTAGEPSHWLSKTTTQSQFSSSLMILSQFTSLVLPVPNL